jgi:hypothetical protein
VRRRKPRRARPRRAAAPRRPRLDGQQDAVDLGAAAAAAAVVGDAEVT